MVLFWSGFYFSGLLSSAAREVSVWHASESVERVELARARARAQPEVQSYTRAEICCS